MKDLTQNILSFSRITNTRKIVASFNDTKVYEITTQKLLATVRKINDLDNMKSFISESLINSEPTFSYTAKLDDKEL